MDLKEARELVNSAMWPKVLDNFLATGDFKVYPAGDIRRLDYVDAATRKKIDLWLTALERAAEWRKVIDGKQVRELREKFPGVYPEVFRYTAYFTKYANDYHASACVFKLLELKFPEVYELCYS